MATTKLHVVGCLRTLTGAAGATINQFNGLSDLKLALGLKEFSEMSGQNIDADYLAVDEQQPVYTCSAVEIATALSALTLDGLPIGPSGTTGNKVEAYWINCKDMTIKEAVAATKHFLAASRKGLIYIESINAPRNRLARANLRFAPIWDATNDIVEYTNNTAAPTGVTIAHAYVAGPVYVNGAEIPSVQEIQYTSGFELEFVFSGGQEWPDAVFIVQRKQKFSIKCKDVPTAITTTLSGLEQAATDSEVYLRKVEKNKRRVAKATAEHIKFTVNAGRIAVQDFGGSQEKGSDVSLDITPAFDGTTAAVVVSTTSAIP